MANDICPVCEFVETYRIDYDERRIYVTDKEVWRYNGFISFHSAIENMRRVRPSGCKCRMTVYMIARDELMDELVRRGEQVA